MPTNGFAEFLTETTNALSSESSPVLQPHIVEHLLTTAYEASLRQDELRRVSFRLLFADIHSITPGSFDRSSIQPILFSEPRPFTAHELRKLAPAVGFSRCMIVTSPQANGSLMITGILYTGAQWLRAIQGGRGIDKLIPEGFIVHVLAPGSIETRYGSKVLSQIKYGSVVHSGIDIFESPWLGNKFAHIRQELLDHFEQSKDPTGVSIDPWLFGKLSQQMLKRFIAAIQGNRHGGGLIIAPQETIDTAVKEHAIVMRQCFQKNEAITRHRKLMLRAATLMSSLGGNLESRKAGWEEYVALSHEDLNSLDDAIFDEAYLAGGLAGADGSVVMNNRFELIGFGAEIFAHDVDVSTIQKSLDNEGTLFATELADSYGTRHRSAFRFVKKYPDALAFVISQDGDVRFICNDQNQVVMFQHDAAFVVELVL